MYNTVNKRGKRQELDIVWFNRSQQPLTMFPNSDFDSNSVGSDDHHSTRVLLSNLFFYYVRVDPWSTSFMVTYKDAEDVFDVNNRG